MNVIYHKNGKDAKKLTCKVSGSLVSLRNGPWLSAMVVTLNMFHVISFSWTSLCMHYIFHTRYTFHVLGKLSIYNPLYVYFPFNSPWTSLAIYYILHMFFFLCIHFLVKYFMYFLSSDAPILSCHFHVLMKWFYLSPGTNYFHFHVLSFVLLKYFTFHENTFHRLQSCQCIDNFEHILFHALTMCFLYL